MDFNFYEKLTKDMLIIGQLCEVIIIKRIASNYMDILEGINYNAKLRTMYSVLIVLVQVCTFL